MRIKYLFILYCLPCQSEHTLYIYIFVYVYEIYEADIIRNNCLINPSQAAVANKLGQVFIYGLN